MHARAFDVLHDARDQGLLAVADGIDFRLDPFEVFVYEDRLAGGDFDSIGHVADEVAGILDDLHGAASEDVAWPNEDGVADELRRRQCMLDGIHRRSGRLRYAKPLEKLFEARTVFGDVDRLRTRAEDRLVCARQRPGEVDRRLAAELDNRRRAATVVRLVREEVPDGLFVEWFEVEAVAGVEVRGHGLGVRVGHDGGNPRFLERPGGVNCRVVELDALADANGPAAQN